MDPDLLCPKPKGSLEKSTPPALPHALSKDFVPITGPGDRRFTDYGMGVSIEG
jgi:hypothetical protein